MGEGKDQIDHISIEWQLFIYLSTEIVWYLSGDQITKSASYPTLMHPLKSDVENI